MRKIIFLLALTLATVSCNNSDSRDSNSDKSDGYSELTFIAIDGHWRNKESTDQITISFDSQNGHKPTLYFKTKKHKYYGKIYYPSSEYQSYYGPFYFKAEGNSGYSKLTYNRVREGVAIFKIENLEDHVIEYEFYKKIEN